MDIIIGDSKSRVLGLSLSLARSAKGVISPIKTKRLQPSTNSGDTHATILVDGSNVQLITAMDSHPNRFITSFLTLQYNKSFYAVVIKMSYKLVIRISSKHNVTKNSYYMIQKTLTNLKVCNRYLRIP